MKKGKSLVIKKKSGKVLFDQLQKEINEENVEKVKGKAKELIKEIRMTEIILEKKKNLLKEILEGKRKYTEEDVYFNEEE